MRTDGIYSEYGTRDEDGRSTQAQSFSLGIGRNAGGRDRAVEEKTWFDPVDSDEPSADITDCPGGVCPVPWAVTPAAEQPVDMVNHPPHYTEGGIECIEAIEAQLTADEFRGYLKGNCVKYLWRERHKGGIESLKKARWYLDRLIQNLEY